MTNGPIIDIDRLRVIYNQGKSNETRALEETNLKIFPKEYIIIFGPSGCGKSTLLYSIAGLQKPTYGEVTIQGIGLSHIQPKQELELHQKRIGMIFQAFYLIPSLTILDNVCLPKTFLGESPIERHDAGMKLLRRFGIAEQADKFPSQLSGGQKQRVAIARSLINNPEIILADEPVGNLDSESAQNVLTILKELNDIDQKTIIMVTHNPEHLPYADRVIHMKDGIITSEEVHEEKRPPEVIKEEITTETVQVSGDLKMLLHSFKNLSVQQLNVLLIPFKAKQLLNHVLSDLTEEQVSMAESLLKELLFNNIDIDQLTSRLDAQLDKGGAGWNKQRATTFSKRIHTLLDLVKTLQESPERAAHEIAIYFTTHFHLSLSEEETPRFESFLRQRMENKINQFELRHRLDAQKSLGGLGFYKGTAEKIARELEMIMLLKYS